MSIIQSTSKQGFIHNRMTTVLALVIGLALLGWSAYQIFNMLASNFEVGDFRVVTRIKGTAHRLAFTPDGRDLVVGTVGDGTQMFSISDGKLLKTLDSGFIFRLALSPDGQILATGPSDHSIVNLWRVSDGRLLNSLDRKRNRVIGLAFSPDGQTLAVADEDGASLWKVDDLLPLRTVSKNALSVAFSPDGQLLAVGGVDEITIWHLSDGKLFHKVPGYGANVAFSPDGRWFASAESATSSNINIWGVANATLIHTLKPTGPLPNFQQVHSLAISPDSQKVATGNINTWVYVWNVTNNMLLERLNLGSGDNGAESITFSPDSQTLAVGTYGYVGVRTMHMP